MNACLLSPELKRRVKQLEESNTRLEESNTKLEESNTKLEESNTKRDDTLSSMDDTLSSMDDTLSSMDDTLSSMDDTLSSMDDTLSSMDDTLSSMQDTLHSMQMEKLNLYIGNMLVDFIEKIYQKRGQSLPPGVGNDPSHSTTQHAQAAQHIERKNLKDLNIPLKYYDALQKFPEVCDLRLGLRVRIT
jgi:septation ring formation regulator EzrA